MDILIYIISAIVFFILGYTAQMLFTNPNRDGRLVIDEEKDEYFIALTTKPEELRKKNTITLDVFLTKDLRRKL